MLLGDQHAETNKKKLSAEGGARLWEDIIPSESFSAVIKITWEIRELWKPRETVKVKRGVMHSMALM